MSQRAAAQPSTRRGGRFRRQSDDPAPSSVEMPRLTQYVTDGHPAREPEGSSVMDALRFADGGADGGSDRMAMLFYPSPSVQDVVDLADAWQLHPLLREDLLNAHQRPKLERYDDVLFIVARSARYIDDAEEIDFAEFHILVRPGAVAVLCQDRRWIDGTPAAELDADRTSTLTSREKALLSDEGLLRLGPEAIAYRLLDAIVDGYAPVLQGLTIDKEQIERQVFSGDAAVAERIYRLSQEVIDMQQAVSSLNDVVAALRGGFHKYGIHDDLQTYLSDVDDHLARSGSRISDLREALSQILNVNATLVAQRQNEDMKKISGWAAILFAPTLIGAIYGMNFDDMPELHWTFGYPMAIGMMLALAVILYVVFKRSKWM